MVFKYSFFTYLNTNKWRCEKEMKPKFRSDDRAILFQLLVGAAMAIIIFFAIMNIGTFINGTIAQELSDNLGTTTAFGSRGTNTLVNLSGDYDNVVDSLAIAAVVMAITLPLAAVVAIRKFF